MKDLYSRSNVYYYLFYFFYENVWLTSYCIILGWSRVFEHRAWSSPVYQGTKGTLWPLGKWGATPTCFILFRSASLSRCRPLKRASSGVCVPTRKGVSAAWGPIRHRERVSSPFPRAGGRACDHSAGVTWERKVECELGALPGGWGPARSYLSTNPKANPPAAK